MSGETKLSFLVDLNAKQATAAARTLKGEVEKLGRSAREAGQGAAAGATGLVQLETAAKGAASAAKAAAQAEKQRAAELALLNKSTTASAQSAGMMAAQWNDVVMMTLAGQNPMQLAIQQGTQMSQAFGQAGAGGALRLLGAGFMSMLNPMNLAVIAAVGLGSGLVQAFMAAGEAQKTAAEALQDYGKGLSALETSISSAKGMQLEYAEAVRSGNATILDALSKEAAARLALMQLDKLDLAEKERASAAAIAAQEAVADKAARKVSDLQAQISKLLDADARGTYGGGYMSGADEAGVLLPILKEETDELDAQNVALQRIRAERDLTKAQIESNTAAELVARQLLSQIEDGTLAVTTGMSNATGQAEAFASGLSRASGILSTIAGQIDSLSLENIDKSAQLAALQAGASPDSARTAGKVAAARDQLTPLLGAPTGAADFARGQIASLQNELSQGAALDAQIAEILKSRTGSGARAGGGGSAADGSAVDKLIAKYRDEITVLQTLDPIQKLIAQNHDAMATATDAERAELVKVIAEKERLTQIEEKVKSIGALGKSAFTGLATGALTFRSALGNVLDGLAQMAASSAWDLLWSGGGRKGGGGLSGIVGGLLGLGGGGGSKGKSKGGGGFGGILAGLLGLADGGRVNGQGGPREDNILIRASAGEYMVNAASTRANLPLVEAINSGASPRQLAAVLGKTAAFANGGMIGGGAGGSLPSGWLNAQSQAQSQGSAGGAREMALTVNVEGARGNSEIMEMVERGVRGGIESFSRTGLPARVRQINADPRRMS